MPDDILSFKQLILSVAQTPVDGQPAPVGLSSRLLPVAQAHAHLMKENILYKGLFNRYAAFNTSAAENFQKASIRMFDENSNLAPLRVFFHDAVTSFLPFMRAVHNSLQASNVAATMYWTCKQWAQPAPRST